MAVSKGVKVGVILLITTVLIVLVAVGGFFAWSGLRDKAHTQAEVVGAAAIETVFKDIDGKLNQIEKLTAALASNEAFKEWAEGKTADSEAVGLLKQTTSENSEIISRATIKDMHGRTLDSEQEAPLFDTDDEGNWYESAPIEKGKVFFTEPYLIIGTDTPALSTAVAIEDEKGDVIAVIGIHSLLRDHLFKGARLHRFGGSGYCWVVDRRGVLISHPMPVKELKESLAKNPSPELRELIARMGRGEDGSVRYTYEGIDKMVFWRVHPKTGWGIAVSAPTQELLEGNRFTSLIIIVVTLVLICLILLVGGIFSLVIVSR